MLGRTQVGVIFHRTVGTVEPEFDKIVVALAEHGAKPLPEIEDHGVGALKEPRVQRGA
jgi:hypothetical protein